MKLLKTNTKQYKSNFNKYFTLMMQNNEYCNTIDKLLLCFDSEYNYDNNKKRYPNLQDRLSEYLQGLPYGFDLCYNWQILDFAAQVHELPKVPENKEKIILKNIYSHCAMMILRLGDDYIIKDLY